MPRVGSDMGRIFL